MNDTLQKRGPLRHLPGNGPLLATVLFCLAYGSVMALVIAPRSLLSASAGDGEDRSVVTGDSAPSASASGFNGTEAQLLKAGFTTRPAEASLYGIAD